MAHELESMFYTQNAQKTKTPWHGLGTPLDDSQKHSVAACIEASGLSWKVRKAPLAIMSKDCMIANGATQEIADSFDGCHNKTVNKFGVVRTSDNSVLGVVGPDYTLVQNESVFNWFQPFLDAEQATLETAGSLYCGQKVWVLAKLNRDPMDIGNGDMVEKFLLLSNSHDGSSSVRVGFSPTRVVCANTLSMAHNSRQSSLIRLCHTSKVNQNLLNIRETIDTVNAQFEATADQYRKLMVRGINSTDLRKYCKLVLDIPLELADNDTPTRTKNRLEDLIRLCTSGIGNDGKTYWSALNGVTQMTSHNYGRTTDSRLDSLWFGVSATMNSKALKLALEMSA
jgi:phage/plasmid-like protein (TIGR03299 family)